jgi:hypothetical protein
MTAEPVPELCRHVAASAPGARPFVVDLVLDERNGPTEMLVHCAGCDAAYLLTGIAERGPRLTLRTFEVASVPRSVAAAFRRDIARGSCDVSRAGAEREAVVAQAVPLGEQIDLDIEGMARL